MNAIQMRYVHDGLVKEKLRQLLEQLERISFTHVEDVTCINAVGEELSELGVMLMAVVENK